MGKKTLNRRDEERGKGGEAGKDVCMEGSGQSEFLEYTVHGPRSCSDERKSTSESKALGRGDSLPSSFRWWYPGWAVTRETRRGGREHRVRGDEDGGQLRAPAVWGSPGMLYHSRFPRNWSKLRHVGYLTVSQYSHERG